MSNVLPGFGDYYTRGHELYLDYGEEPRHHVEAE